MYTLSILCQCCFAFLVASSVAAFFPSNSSVSPDDGETSGPWSCLLEDWAVGHTERKERILQVPNTSGYYISDRVDSVPSSWSQEYNPPQLQGGTAPGKVINQPHYSANYQKPTPPTAADSNPNRKLVSETDLYLLGAIEKLVYRVDFMEKRLKKAEEVIYYLMAGNNRRQDPCVQNFTRVGSNCYHFSTSHGLNWKSASDACKAMGATLAEMETIEENQDVVSFIQATPPLRGNDFWTGGLNPGLLWIWSNSARPVATGGKTEQQIVNSAASAPPKNISSPSAIRGEGRCLKLAYNPPLRTYSYLGYDCAIRQHYICEIFDKTLSNEIRRISRELNLE